jgi:hypothetical protein
MAAGALCAWRPGPKGNAQKVAEFEILEKRPVGLLPAGSFNYECSRSRSINCETTRCNASVLALGRCSPVRASASTESTMHPSWMSASGHFAASDPRSWRSAPRSAPFGRSRGPCCYPRAAPGGTPARGNGGCCNNVSRSYAGSRMVRSVTLSSHRQGGHYRPPLASLHGIMIF